MSSFRTLSTLPRVFFIMLAVLLFLLIPDQAKTQEQEKPYKDLVHFSKVFGHNKFYRIYLPDGYESGTQRYPVIYFFHGWGGRHFKDDNALLEYEMIGDLVDKFKLILVMWDGNIEESEPRPYNIGNHKDIKYNIQMKDYFPELVTFIDSAYRTVADRNHRGIIGFSMGGIMSFFLAGKYPHMVCAAVDLAGTPEFFIGYPQNHTLYPLRYTFKNLMDVSTRQHSGDTDILVYLNEEVKKGAEWEGCPYEFYGFSGGHMVDNPRETKAFEMAVKFVTDNFGRKTGTPSLWSHYDIYNDFKVWDYQVNTNKNVPGFLFLSDVTTGGFGFYSHKWLPDGPALDNLIATITTAPLYTPQKKYKIVRWSALTNEVSTETVSAGSDGSISLTSDGYGSEFGISGETDPPGFIVSKFHLNDSEWLLATDVSSRLYVELLNRGGETKAGEYLKASIRTSDRSVTIPVASHQIQINPEQRLIQLPPFEISCNKQPPPHGEPYQIKLFIDVETDDSLFTDELILPILFDAPCFDSIKIDDGAEVKHRIFGKGNGDGIANPGENILLYNGGHRLRVFTNDPWVIFNEEELLDQQIPAIWEDGFTLSSVISIAEDCPDGHIIEFTGYYETNTWNPIERNLHWGKAFIIVRNINYSIK
ncbi:MAG TPA: alpha/beta hydrolase-fold protein [Bacteroidales bacterium]|nr:alpha/beta hydrolase-fold protein [Bacteroidales bacterium]